MEKLQTKYKENRFSTSVLEEMKNMYTAERVVRRWNEDFTDEETGEVVSVERKEIILDRGVLLDNITLQTIHFHISNGDISEVLVSDQKRDGMFTDGFTTTWISTAVIGGKKKNIYLYANSPKTALEITTDYIEQQYPGSFQIVTVKESDGTTLITNLTQETEGELKYYKIVVEIQKEDVSYNNSFIVRALNAENGKSIIEAFLKAMQEKKKEDIELFLTIESAKVIPCEAVIDVSFCKEYLKDE
ncbi:hypothetical protein ABE425_14800 [Chryseobacterium cucumeris]|uniref:hypothetical protein n=1 Tax=Chryseobacterium cucumeris TaxID=1813611 RepID=UPI0032084C72